MPNNSGQHDPEQGLFPGRDTQDRLLMTMERKHNDIPVTVATARLSGTPRTDY